MKSVVLAIIVAAAAAAIPTIISAMSVLTVAVPFRVAIIGGGVSGCASARRLAQLAPTAQITLYEIGRGPGGRASTRKTRSLPGVYINHGAPYCDIRTDLGRSLITSLDTGTAPFTGVRGRLEDSTGKFSPYKEEEDAATMYITGANGEMSQISSSLLSDLPSVNTKYKTMIRGLAKTADGVWEMRDKSDTLIGSADWLIVAGSGVAHPRWTKSFGGVPPLIEAESNSPDPLLRQALDEIAKQQTSPVMTVFFSFTGQVAREWLSLDFNVAEVEGSSILSKIIVHGNNNGDGNDEIDDWCSVVLHSTEDFANQNSGTYGASSSAARIAGAASDSSLEDALIAKMMNALAKIPGIPTTIDTVKMDDNSYYGPMLHRWGNAFPKGEALAQDLAFLPSSRISFCGDYVASPEQARFGSCEAALLSGTFAGESIANYYAESVIE
jgi:predicted NAD/FAD-dependent oxidoreductase